MKFLIFSWIFLFWAVANAVPAGMVASSHVQQCVSPLPIGGTVNLLGRLSQLEHTWLQVGSQTFGMPFTLDHGYFGGPAVITSPDAFISETEKAETCAPVYRPADVPEHLFSIRTQCIAEKLSFAFSGQFESWYPILDYHVFKSNCESAVRFMLDCAGGEMSQNPNAGIGSHYEPDKLMMVSNLVPGPMPVEFTAFSNHVDKAFYRIERGSNSGSELGALATELNQMSVRYHSSPLIAKKVAHLQEILNKIVARIQYWDGMQMEFIKASASELQIEASRNVADPYQRFPEIKRTSESYREICERARAECI